MRFTIIGWYGTETIGDRAILAGIFKILSQNFGKIEVRLGSLFPFFSERTLTEDYLFWEELCGNPIKITLFDSKRPAQLRKAIKNSDALIMGGGPLMHIPELQLVDYAFKKAKKAKKKTIIGGCGIGPIYNKKYHKVLYQIINNSDTTYLRDLQAINNLKAIAGGEELVKSKKIISSYDPAIIPGLFYKNTSSKTTNENIVVNFREFPPFYSKNSTKTDDKLITFIKDLKDQFDSEIKLVPMHYCSLGEDDREYFYKLLMKIEDRQKISIQAKPLSLNETFSVFACAKLAIGMRYHSVFFQTLLNGNNYIIDYTEPNKGKIAGFIKDIDENSFYKDRYINLQINQNIDFKFTSEKFNHSLNLDKILNEFSEFK
jgi:polysaccharide pyruvyl transferase WcaK-like protein